MFAYLLVASVLILAGFIDSANAGDRSGRQPQLGGLRKPDGTPASTLININNIAGWIRNDGWSARIPSSGNSGVFFPRSTAAAIFQDGIVWGGNVNDGGSQVLRVGGQTYSIGTIGGRIISAGVAASPNDPDVRVYRIRRDYKTADLKQDAGEFFEKGLNAVTAGDIATIRAQYGTDWNEWPTSQGAPYYDRDSNGVYNAGIDEPGVADADQVVWFVCNDLNPGRTNALYGSNPIGLELQVTLWGYNRTDPLANVYFKKFTFIYKGTTTTPPNATITDMYVGQWSDPDMGDSGDDYAGCDTSLSLVYVYNGSPSDVEYAKFGLKPPAVGYDFLQGPLVRGISGQDLNKNGVDDAADRGIFNLKRTTTGKINLPMTAAFYFAAGGTISDPPFTREGTIQWYNLLRGLIPITGQAFVHPNVPGPTKFWLDGDVVAGTGRLDGVLQTPSDRRIGACSGPFTMARGDTQEVVLGVVAGIGVDYKSSITVMKNNDIAVQNAYNDLFDLPKAPPSPKVKGIALNKQIVLEWGSDLAGVTASESYDNKGYTFEGYNVYQLPSPSASFSQAIKLATYDLEGNGVRTIYDDVFDVALGIIIRVVRQQGTDSGIQRQLVINEDRVRALPLVNGQYYYFAVTSYGYNPSDQALTHALESSIQIITVVPKTPDPGYKVSSQFGEELTVVNTNQGIQSDGGAVPVMVDPTVATGQKYQVKFRNVSTTFRYPARYPTFDTVYTVTQDQLNWTVYRGQDSIYNDVNQGPTSPIDPGIHVTAVPPRRPTDFDALAVLGSPYNYPIIDGFYLPVSGPPPQLSVERSRFTSGGNANGRGWLGAVGRFSPSTSALRSQVTTANDIPIFYLGSVGNGVTPDKYRDVEFRFGAGGSLTQKGYRYRRIGTYQFQNYTDVPFQVWDVSNPAAPRQLNCGWRDQNNNGLWDPDGNVEVIFVATTTYNGNTAPPANPSYGLTPGEAVNTLPLKDYQCVAEWISVNRVPSDITASTILVSPNRVLSANDVYEFSAPAAATYDAKQAKADVSQINVFPNPYYGFNRAETSRNSRFVTFNHLPPSAEVRIFNLAGALVRAFEKNDASQHMNWDMRNQNGLPVASGVYIAYINMPTLGATKTLKLIVVQEQQFLDNF